jgi:hypothetical protein
MMTRSWVAISFGILVVSIAVSAQEKRLQRKDLPPAVEKAVMEQSKGGTIKGFSTEVENGKKIYEMTLAVDGHARDVSFDANGHVLEIEDEVAFDGLPAAVKDGLTRAAGKAKITKVESLTKGGKLLAYEAVVTAGTKHREIQVGPDGKKLAHAE